MFKNYNKLFSEKNISKLIIITPIFAILLISFFITYFFVTTQYTYFEEESKIIEKQYIQKQKNILKHQLNSVINYINVQKEINPTLSTQELKKQITKYVQTIRYERNGYIWIHDTAYFLIAHPFRKDKLNTFDIELTDAKGTLITKLFVDKTLKNPNGVFIKYYWEKPNEHKISQKLGYFKLYDEFSWVLGAGLYMDDIQKSIFENKKLLELRINKYIKIVILISLLSILIIGVIAYIISKKTNEALSIYKSQVQEKELLKDRAMFHQSRLARMGIMISLIAHQWRQPLNELSTLLMEVETASKFNNLSKEKLETSLTSSNQLISFMSNTIDDFRNFFKPDKKMATFLIQDAYKEAISLADASIKDLNITLVQEIEAKVSINGYEREFSQVILNLILNAKDAIRQRKIENPSIKIRIYTKQQNAIITIEDNAKGINKEDLNMIFEPYFSTKSASTGTGLGLYISKMIIENNMHGTLRAKNTKEGAIFKIEIKHV